MSRTKQFLLNSFSGGLHQLVVFIAGLIVPRVTLVFFGSDVNGLVASATNFIGYLGLVEAGLAQAAIFALYRPLAEKNWKSVSSVVSAARRFYNLTALIFAGLTVLLAFVFPLFRSARLFPYTYVLGLVLVIGAASSLEFTTMSKYRVLLTADQKTYVLSLATIAAIILNSIIIVVMAKLGADILLIRTVALTSVFLRSGILWVFVKLKYKNVSFKASPNKSALNKRWDALILQILGVVQLGAPVAIATLFLNMAEVSVYNIFFIVINGINSLLSIFLSGTASSFGDVIVKGDRRTLKRSYSEFEFAYTAIIAVIYSVTAVMLMSFVRYYTRDINDVDYNRPLLGLLFALSGILYNIKTPQAMLVNAAGMFRETRKQTIIQGTILVAGGCLLVPFFGLYGILAAVCLSNLYRCVDLLFFVPKNITGLPVRRSAFRMASVIPICAVVLLTFSFFNIAIGSFFSFMLWSLAVLAAAVLPVVVWAFVFEQDDLARIIVRIILMIKRKAAPQKQTESEIQE